jgi:iron(III) transport system ATP-binding protein
VAKQVEEALTLVHLEEFLDRPATNLSGGQQQRLALARAIIGNPKLQLLDEPLSNLDAKLREEMRGEMKRVQQALGVTTIYVAHDQSEALSMLDTIAVMNNSIKINRRYQYEKSVYCIHGRSFNGYSVKPRHPDGGPCCA